LLLTCPRKTLKTLQQCVTALIFISVLHFHMQHSYSSLFVISCRFLLHSAWMDWYVLFPSRTPSAFTFSWTFGFLCSELWLLFRWMKLSN
jgi:hypothetical protein